MTLIINIGTKKEKRLMRHLKVEHPSVLGNIRVIKGNRHSVNKMLKDIPDFEKQVEDFTQVRKLLKGGKK